MHKEMRRKDRQIAVEEAMAILEDAEYGFLSTVDEDNSPYVIPVSFVVIENKIYFHGAKAGRKLDNIAYEPRVCFSVAGETQTVYDGGYSTYYKSVVVFGKAYVMEEENEKKIVLTKLVEKYFPEYMDRLEENLKASFHRTAVIAITIDEITGKAKKRK